MKADARGEVNLRKMPMLLNNHSKEMAFKRRRRSMFLNFNLSDTSGQGNTSVLFVETYHIFQVVVAALVHHVISSGIARRDLISLFKLDSCRIHLYLYLL